VTADEPADHGGKAEVNPVESESKPPDDKPEQVRESRLPFVRSFPDDPELNRLIAAFEAGDFATVRADAAKLAERTQNAEVKKAALDLRRRIEPDPMQLYLLGITLLLLVFLTAWFYLHKQ
jgi:hypothetical protein